MRLLLAGDTHGNQKHLDSVFAVACRYEADLIIQLGDFGFGWTRGYAPDDPSVMMCAYSHYASHLSQQTDIPLYWIGGNHENYDFLDETVGTAPADLTQINPSVFYIARGAKIKLGGHDFLFSGGACSIDKNRRVDGVSWWRQEEISYADIDRCKAAGDADVLITHDFPWEVNVVDRHLDPYWGAEAQEKTIASRQRTSEILANCGATYVFHGHLHMNYREDIQVNGQQVHVMGLDCDGTPMPANTFLLDTTELD